MFAQETKLLKVLFRVTDSFLFTVQHVRGESLVSIVVVSTLRGEVRVRSKLIISHKMIHILQVNSLRIVGVSN